ncbi:hypothetical protein EXW96_02045 [Paenibacillus sp. JMULE4]|nr:hypothetical protein [Paenibacillus sp. JMULE4]
MRLFAEGVIASELFGYAAGAFTGARQQGNPGKIEAANGGTLFLDEIADMPLELQAVLLRALEESKLQESEAQPLFLWMCVLLQPLIRICGCWWKKGSSAKTCYTGSMCLRFIFLRYGNGRKIWSIC